MPQFWAEISDKLSYMYDMLSLCVDLSNSLDSLRESLADPLTQDAIPSDDRPLAALLISKVYFYMGELDEAVEFALRAGSAFDKQPEGEYKETIIGQLVSSLDLRWKLTLVKRGALIEPLGKHKMGRSWIRTCPTWLMVF